jgi:hypothetical protein
MNLMEGNTKAATEPYAHMNPLRPDVDLVLKDSSVPLFVGRSDNYIRSPGPGVVNCLTGLFSPSLTPSLPIEVTV